MNPEYFDYISEDILKKLETFGASLKFKKVMKSCKLML